MTRRTLLQAAGALATLAVVALVVLLLRGEAPRDEPRARSAAPAAEAAALVLPRADADAAPSALVDADAEAAAPEAPRDAPTAAAAGPGTPLRLVGRVLDPQGAPLPGARVLFVPDARTLAAAGAPLGRTSRLDGLARDELAAATSGPDGRFELTGRIVARRAGEKRSNERPGMPVLLVSAGDFALLGHQCHDLRGELYDAGDLVLSPGLALQGRVTDADGHALPDAQLAAALASGWAEASRPPDEVEAWWHVTRADAGGRYLLAGLPPMSLTLMATANGYVTGSLALQYPDAGVLSGQDIALAPGASVSGTVVDPEGHPVPGAKIAVLETSLEERGTSHELWMMDMALAPARSDGEHADGEGRFTLAGLTAQNLTLCAWAEGFTSVIAYDVAPGRSDVVLALLPPAVLRVRVRDRDTGAPVTATLAARRAQALNQAPASWVELLPVIPAAEQPGDYLVRGAGSQATWVDVSADGHVHQTLWADGLPAGATGELAVDLEHGIVLAGRVTDEAGAPVADAGVQLRRFRDPRTSRFTTLRNTDADGRFAFEAVAAGEYALQVEAAGFAVQECKPIADAGVQPAPLAIVLRRAGDIEGVLLDHESRPAASYLVEAQGPDAGFAMMRTDTSGRFALRDLLPGTWSLSCVSTGDVPVEVSAGDVAQVELRLAPPSFILGRVTCAGLPVAGAKLVLQQDGYPLISSSTGSDGRFKLQVAVGTWRVEVSTDVGGSAETTVDVLRGESRRADFDLPNGALVIHAHGPQGEPAAEARLAFDQLLGTPGDTWVLRRFYRTGTDGTLRLGQLEAGHYRMRSLPGGPWLPGEPVEVDVGASGTAEMSVSVRPAANIVGRLQVANGLPVPEGSTVSLYRASGEPAGSSRVDRDGSFAFDGLEPGGYVLGVYQEAPDKLGDKPALVDQAITLEGGQEADVSLVLPAQG